MELRKSKLHSYLWRWPVFARTPIDSSLCSAS